MYGSTEEIEMSPSDYELKPPGDLTRIRTQEEHLNRWIILMIFVSAIGGFLFGYDTGVVSGAMLLIRYIYLHHYFFIKTNRKIYAYIERIFV